MTGAEIVRRILKTIGAIPASSQGTSVQINDGLFYVNQMLDSWAAEKTLIYETRRQAFPLAADTQTYTLGTGGTMNVARPVFLPRDGSGAGIVWNYGTAEEMELGIRLLTTASEWAEVIDKNRTGERPSGVYIDGAFPRRNVIVTPIPTVGTYYLSLYLPTAVTQLALDDDYTFPPGYGEAIHFNGAEICCLPFGRQVPAKVTQFAEQSLNRIRTVNGEPGRLRCDPAILNNSGVTRDIMTGGYK